MILTAALTWYDEPPDELRACVAAVGTVADRIVAVDGAYARYPDGRATSPLGQVRAIREAADAAGLDCLIVQRNRLWAGQVEKRSFLLAAAAAGSDWVMVVDSDHIVHGDRASVVTLLLRTSEHAIEVPYLYPENPDRPLGESAATLWAENLAGQVDKVPHFYRALPGLRVERFHWWVSALVGGDRHWIVANDTDDTYRRESRAQLPPGFPYHVEHRCLFRTRDKILGNRAFCNDRVMVVAQTGQEDDVPGLPPPVFDFEERLV